jgi:hypothetical protein
LAAAEQELARLKIQPKPAPAHAAERITPQAALEATLVSWLCLRDFAIWAFVQGANPVAQMNAMQLAAKHFAHQIAGKNDPGAVLQAAIDKVRQAHAPMFSLTVPNLPSAF